MHQKNINEVMVMAVVCQLRFGKVNGLPSGGGGVLIVVWGACWDAPSRRNSHHQEYYMFFVFRGSL